MSSKQDTYLDEDSALGSLVQDDRVLGAPIGNWDKECVIILKKNDPEQYADKLRKLMLENTGNPLKILYHWKNDSKFWYTKIAAMLAEAEKASNVLNKELFDVCNGPFLGLGAIKKLLDEGADPTGYVVPDSSRPNALFCAIAKMLDAEYVDMLLSKMSKESVLRSYNSDGNPAYVFADACGSDAAKKVLEKHGYKIESDSDYYRKSRAIFDCAVSGDADELRKQLKLNGNPCKYKKYGSGNPQNSLFAAVEGNNAECVDVLLGVMTRKEVLEILNDDKLAVWVVAAESSDEVQKLFEKHRYKVDDGSYERPEVESFDEDEDFDY